jgi:hypothetical protein
MNSQIILKDHVKLFQKNRQADTIMKRIRHSEKQRDFLYNKIATDYSSLISLLTHKQ